MLAELQYLLYYSIFSITIYVLIIISGQYDVFSTKINHEILSKAFLKIHHKMNLYINCIFTAKLFYLYIK